MNTEQFKGRKAKVKSTGYEGVIANVTARSGGQVRSYRFIIDDINGRPVEYMPHEIEIESPIVTPTD